MPSVFLDLSTFRTSRIIKNNFFFIKKESIWENFFSKYVGKLLKGCKQILKSQQPKKY